MPVHRRARIAISVLLAACASSAPASSAPAYRTPTSDAPPWTRHTIDDASRGADGVRLDDANSDGLPDVVTGWEEGGIVRLVFHPGRERCRERWPGVTVGKAESVEDAVPVDLDGDGAMDVVSACEGRARTIFLHWAPADRRRILEPGSWRTEPLTPSRGMMAWMFCAPADVDGKGGVDLVAGGKGEGAAVGWWESPKDPRDAAAWRWHALRPAGWVMSIVAVDMDADGLPDVLVSDRKGAGRGAFWLGHPGRHRVAEASWGYHAIGGQGREVMFLAVVRDAPVSAPHGRLGVRPLDVLVATKPREVLRCSPRDRADGDWETIAIPLPGRSGSAKAVASGDVDLDGKPDLVLTCEEASCDRLGIYWIPGMDGDPRPDGSGPAEPRDIGGRAGEKYDLVELIDVDGDGDVDALACEEAAGLGVVWYENPLR